MKNSIQRSSEVTHDHGDSAGYYYKAAHLECLMRSGIKLFFASILFFTAGSTYAASTHPVKPSDIDSLKDVVSVAMAPNSENVIYTVKGAPSKWCPGQTTLWIVGNEGKTFGHKLPFTIRGDTAPRWSPDGEMFAFTRDGAKSADKPGKSGRCTRGGDAARSGSNLWVASYPALEAHQLTSIKGAIKMYRWSPDGKTIAAIVIQPNPEPSSGPRLLRDLSSPGRIYLIDAVSGSAHRLDVGDNVSVYDLSWFPDNGRLAIRVGNSSRYGAQFYESRLEVVDLKGKILQTIKDTRVSYQHPAVSPNGKELLYGHFYGSKGVAPVYVLYDLKGNSKHPVGTAWNGTVEDLVWASNNKLFGIGLEGVHTYLISVSTDNFEVSRVLLLKGQAAGLTMPEAGRYAFIGNTRTQPNEVWLYNRSSNNVRVVTDTNPQVRNWQLADIRAVRWKSSIDGTPLSGLLALPEDAKANVPLKALVQAHGGPREAWQDGWQGTWEAWAQVLTSNGYAVFMPDPRGSAGRGHKFANGNVGDWGGADYQDIMDGVAKLVSEKVIDPNSLAIGGWSYGGYMSSWAAGHNDGDIKFRAAIVGAPPTDLLLMVFNSDLGYYFTGAYFGDPFENRALYVDRSPISSVRNVAIPVLIMHGGSDHRVPTANGELFYHALKHYGKVADLVIYPNATHWLSASVGSEAQGDVQQRVLAWLERYLGAPRDQHR